MPYGLTHTFTPGNFLVVPGYSLFYTMPLGDSSITTGSDYESSISPGMTVTLAGGNWANGTPSSNSNQASVLFATGQRAPAGTGSGNSGNATEHEAEGDAANPTDTDPMDGEIRDDKTAIADSVRKGLADNSAFYPRKGDRPDPAALLAGPPTNLSNADPEIVRELVDQLNGLGTAGQRPDFRNHPDFVVDPTHPNGGYIAAVPRYFGGEVVGSMGTAGDSKTKPLSDEELDAIQLALDVIGLAPGLGEFADAASGSISVARGDKVGAALSALSLAPLAGQAPGVQKIVRRFKMLFGRADEAAAAAKAVGGAADAGSSVGRMAGKVDDALDEANKVRSKVDDGVAEAMERLDNAPASPAEAMRKADVEDISPKGDLTSTIGGEPIDPADLDRMRAAFEGNGGSILQSADIDAYLTWRAKQMGADNVGGVTRNAKQIDLPTNATRTAVFEEFIHTAQFRTGRYDKLVKEFGNAEAERLLEIEAAEKLIRNQRAWGLPQGEVDQVIKRLEQLKK